MNCKYKKNLLWLLVSATLLTGCGGSDSNSSSDTTTKDIQVSGPIGQSISGLALGNNSEDSKDNLHNYVLAVLDNKHTSNEENKSRFALLHIDKNDQPIVEEMDNAQQVEWNGNTIGNDLESICKLNNDYYLAAESGYFHDKNTDNYLYGRIFLIHRSASLDPDGLINGILEITKVYNIANNPKDFANVNFEGLACAKANDGTDNYNILLGDRESGKLYWDSINSNDFTAPDSETLELKQVGEIKAPQDWRTNRNISDLFYSTQDHLLYGAASFDNKTTVHRSTLYRSSKAFKLESTPFMEALGPDSKVNIDKIADFKEDKIEGITGYGIQKGMFFGSDNDNNNNTYGYKLHSHITK
ncbi:hypothetical protein SKA34_07508 [Photobacterium sp. SKA34]|uniref:hypothetical protein n=1 Tax=Photobacterium sp. SKA34 TaxID=121723 RepID=UPI00006BBEF6|nr:hypothetical protein [Photobacterium sp. SKA34]EAR53998.1 hypothetical protein SKA34_07508 [Photobacterium sp. SKA34]